MKNLFVVLLALLISFGSYGQDDKILTKASIFVKDATLTKTIYDYTSVARFKAGTGEYIEFYPVQITNLKTSDTIRALRFETLYNTFGNQNMFQSGFVDIDEIEELAFFLETYIAPNIKKQLGVNEGEKVSFVSKELEIEYMLQKRSNNGGAAFMTRQLSFKINDRPYENSYFWTAAKIKKIPDFIEVLKKMLVYSKQ